ncbi:MAG: TIGR03960 family B12-binding radical SAM protein [Candidatus Omnitrophica bacterium]|nr:TIGR03960 family B12-binding radical SAM protein [Candidatus Omnitrophota bacterium]
MWEELLENVNKPGRYIGQEWNIPGKDFCRAPLQCVLAFPDVYEIGMSNLGIRILYGILNSLQGVSCERVFCPETDMEEQLRKGREKLFSLETKRPLGAFDILGFSLGYELCYTNVLRMLELADIPLNALQRTNQHPLVIGGGPCVMNPEPLHAFFDLFIIGEAEEAIVELLRIYQQHKEAYRAGTLSKEDLLLYCAKVEGVYVPSLYQVRYTSEGRIAEYQPLRENIPAKVKKRFVKDLNASYFPVSWLVPYIQIVHDRIFLEVTRGCPNRCVFCQARSQYFPYRQRAPQEVLRLAEEAYQCTGYEEIAVGGLSMSDYTHIEELLRQLVDRFQERAVGISLPSLKAKSLVGGLSSVMARIRKAGLTFAPEAGTVRLRELLAKDFIEEEFFQALTKAYAAGYQHIKLYFMIGFPFEEEADLEAIVDFSLRASEARKQFGKGGALVNVSLSTLIPKPHTSLQWSAMESLQRIKEKQSYVRMKNKYRKLQFSFHNPPMSFLEGVLSRGDRRLSEVILRAHQAGARFDAWSNHFQFGIWQKAFEEEGIDPEFYLRQIPLESTLPWDIIDVGISKETLRGECGVSSSA